jgi:hypothetical protein
MRMSKPYKMFYQSERKLVLPFLASFLIANLVPMQALSVVIDAPSKKGSLQLDGYAHMTAGAGPTTNDVSNPTPDASATPDPSANANATGNATADLKPVTLDSADNSSASGDSGTAGDGVLKSTVRETVVAPHDTNEQVLEEASVAPANASGKGKHKKGKEAKSLVQQGKDVAVGPLPLLTTDNDDKKTAEFINTAEKEQIADLWESTLTRSPDVQFVIQKLQPTSNQAHLNSTLTKLLGAAMYGAMGMSMMMMPNSGMAGYAMMSGGSSAISSVLGIAQNKADKRAKLSQEEQMIMLGIVRTTADKLVASYRDYKKFFVSLARASNDLQDLQAMAAEARSGQDAAKQLEMDYTLRKAQRDIDQISDDVRRNRCNLIDLAGTEAVAKLDKQIIWEQTQVDQGQTGATASNPDGGAAPASDSSKKADGGAVPASDSSKKPADTSTQAQDPNAAGDKPQTASANPSPPS